MTRWFARTANAAVVLMMCGSAFAANLPADRYLADPSRGAGHYPGAYYGRPYTAPATAAPVYRPPVRSAPVISEITVRVYQAPAAAAPVGPEPSPTDASVDQSVPQESRLPNAWSAVLIVGFLATLVWLWVSWPKSRSSGAVVYLPPRGTPGSGVRSSLHDDPPPRPSSGGGISASSEFPAQEEWAQRAGSIRNPISGYVFGVRARANAHALQGEQNRMKSARDLIKEYAGMYADLLQGEEAATAYAVRRDLSGEHYEHELAKQREVFDDSAHRRELADKRRGKELTEADTRRIEAQHEQEALERFKEPKFVAGLARFEAKSKEHLVGAATADAAIAETKVPAEPEKGGNENAEVAALYALLQEKMQAVEEGERLGQDTQGLREKIELYKKLLNLA